uniref:Proteoglycan 4-like n=1 Tax=Elaeis guineensis var. tenera TaxID=51953 RepID=A0A6I9RD62_ELAGV|nr:proteoglycan 4-like [Elaeis guineensis]
MADRPNRLRPFRFWLPFWANPSLTPPRPPIPTQQQPLPQTPASTPLPPAEPQHPSQTQPKSPPAPATPQLAIQNSSRSPSPAQGASQAPVANQVESQILSQPPSPSSPPKSPIGSTSPSNQPELLPHESPTLVQTKSPTQLQPHALPQTQETNPIQSASKPTDDHPARDPESKPYPSISEKETKQTQEEKPRTIPEPKPDKQPGKLLESEAHSEPASKEQPETKNPESDRLAEGFKGKLETEPEIEPQKPQNEAGKIIAELRISKPGHSKEQDNVDREESAQNGSGGKENKIAISTMPWTSSSDGERAPFEKEIEKRHSRLVQKVGIGERMGNGQPVSMITLAGENNGASMVLGSHIHIHRGFKHPKGDVEASYDDPAITATINSNAQSINNSTFHGSSCNERDPGVHLKLSSKKVEAASLRRQPEPLKPQKTDASLRRPPEPIKPQKTAPRITPEQKPSHEPRIRRRCLRALFMESSDSDPENPQKPQRHGCRFCCDEKKKEKADIGATSTANGNARARQAEEGTSRA